ncbi:dihydropyrimidinase [candidate division KSB1 bacterium]|nr:MAG: dihydropyrimidinase [candidate division KSB1 bacterium]
MDLPVIIIKNGSVVTPAGLTKFDILIEEGRFAGFGDFSEYRKADFIIDAKDKIIIPGLIDPNVHFNGKWRDTPVVHDFYSGSVSAAYGGVTTIIDFARQKKNESLKNTVEELTKKAKKGSVIDYSFHCVITDITAEVLNEIGSIISYGVPSFKYFFIFHEDGIQVDNGAFYEILKETGKYGGIVGVHSENYDIVKYNVRKFLKDGKTSAVYYALSSPNIAEAECAYRSIFLANSAGTSLYFFHLSTKEAVEIVGSAKWMGYPIFAETSIYYLVLTEDVYKRKDGMKWICTPPLRKKLDIDSLWNGLNDGRISVVSSDDMAFNSEDKLSNKDSFNLVPEGLPGVEVRLPILFTEGVLKRKISLKRLVEITSTNVAKLFGMFPRKGIISIRSDADLVILDPDKEVVLNSDSLHMKTDWCPVEGMRVKGLPEFVISRGEIIVEKGKFCSKKGRGKFIRRKIKPELRREIV